MTSTAADFVRLRTPRLRVPFRGDVLARVGLGLLLVFAFLAAFGPLLPLGDPQRIGVGPPIAAPTWDWLAGTDSLGRSLLPRLVEGIRTTFLLAGVAVALSAAAGVLIGMAAAFYGGVFEELTVRSADVMFSFPGLLFALLVVTIVGPGAKGAVIAIAVLTLPMMVRVVRAASLRVVGRDFVIAARVGGAGPLRIMFVHLLPNVAGTAIVQATYLLSVGMLIESGLSFLGLGVLPPHASLGSLVAEGSVYLPVAPRLVLLPGIVLALAITSVNLVGDGLRDVLDIRAAEQRQ